jgi:16S rRNA (adenine1518-N6/adenine1519-N6)-dimethyltransferase
MGEIRTFQKKSLSQIFLKDKNIIQKIVNVADIKADETIVEIGCGEGILSEELAKKAKELFIIEIDRNFLLQTQERLKNFDDVFYINQDVLKTDFSKITKKKFRIIANIPYHLSAKIVKKIIDNKAQVKSTILMVQKEFGEKLNAEAGSEHYGSLTIYSSFFLENKYLFDVSRNCFWPKPKVDSAVIEIIPKAKPLYDVDEEIFFSIVRSAFWGRRKTLLNCLEKSPYMKRKIKYNTLPFFLENPKIRGEVCSTEVFYRIYNELMELGY